MQRFAALAFELAVAACASLATEVSAQQDPATLVGPNWGWVGTLYRDLPKVEVPDPARFTLAFQPGGRANVRADCNRGGGSYTADAHRLEFGPMALTKMRCEYASADREFLRGLEAASEWSIRDGELVVILKLETGTMRFRPLPK